MIIQLHIRNFVFIEDITIDFSSRLNVLTGETGAGKSILIDSIRFVLGERFEGTRLGSEGASRVEAAFELGAAFLKDHPILDAFVNEDENTLILARELSDGKSRSWINNHFVTLTTLKEIGSLLIDIHGQYDHQLLLDHSCHLDLVDRFAKTEPLKKDYAVLYEKFRELKEKQSELESLEEGKERELDLLKYQMGEIERAKLEDMNEEEVANEKMRLANTEKLHELTARALAVLDEQEPSAASLVSEARRDIEALLRFDSKLDTLKENYTSAQLHLEEVIRTLKEYQANLTFDPERLKELERQQDLLELLKRKYGGSYSAVIDFYRKAKEKYAILSDTDLSRKEIRKEIKKIEPELEILAAKLTEKRKKAGLILKKNIEAELQDLNIPNARFETEISTESFSPAGRDRLEFLVGLNAGQPLLPLKKSISGGEASRVMLAMKKALMKVDPIPTLIFDEIDANIGGRLGSVTGGKLKEISEERQVLLITHLPQIASFADKHFKVVKSVKKGKTLVDYSVVEGEERVRELAQMMSGRKETEIAKKHAEEMLKRN